jgi:D-arabinose 1-dehydrogenase-like Zn-dependent alcohol dehydrogenase
MSRFFHIHQARNQIPSKWVLITLFQQGMRANLKKLEKRYDLLLNTVSADIDLEPYLQMLKLDGTLVVIGLPGKPYAINAGTLLGQRRIIIWFNDRWNCSTSGDA